MNSPKPAADKARKTSAKFSGLLAEHLTGKSNPQESDLKGIAENFKAYLPRCSTTDLVVIFRELRDTIDRLAEAESAITSVYEHLRKIELPQRMESEGVENIAVAGAGRVHVQAEIEARIPAEQKDAAFQWLEDHGHGDLIKPTVHTMSLKALVKELLAASEEIPEELIKIHIYEKAVLRKA